MELRKSCLCRCLEMQEERKKQSKHNIAKPKPKLTLTHSINRPEDLCSSVSPNAVTLHLAHLPLVHSCCDALFGLSDALPACLHPLSQHSVLLLNLLQLPPQLRLLLQVVRHHKTTQVLLRHSTEKPEGTRGGVGRREVPLDTDLRSDFTR